MLRAAKPDPNFPVDGEGRSMHLQVKKGELANRILTVGDVGRARKFTKFLDADSWTTYTSSRGFTTFTGTYHGVPVYVG
jgi:uridine phosphorylase